MAMAIARTARPPRKVKLGPQFNGFAPNTMTPWKASFCHAEHDRLGMVTLPIRHFWHANVPEDRVSDTGISVPSVFVTEKGGSGLQLWLEAFCVPDCFMQANGEEVGE